jgi:hypothetical protein
VNMCKTFSDRAGYCAISGKSTKIESELDSLLGLPRDPIKAGAGRRLLDRGDAEKFVGVMRMAERDRDRSGLLGMVKASGPRMVDALGVHGFFDVLKGWLSLVGDTVPTGELIEAAAAVLMLVNLKANSAAIKESKIGKVRLPFPQSFCLEVESIDLSIM